ncbi:MAG: citrate lyase subunit alpha, partial [Bacillota bacterium]|nr:citrate lyase subunit alpha [Bacillota bacterium]
MDKYRIDFKDKGKIKRKSKVREDLEKLIDELEIKDSMTVSFHHHFRNGDVVGDMVMKILDKKGIKNLTIFPSSLTSAHDHFGEYIKSGLIGRICTSGLRGKLGQDISSGILEEPVVIRSHGGRARAIISGDEKIDVAFIAAPHCDVQGNSNGFEGKSPCGSLGYAQVDARYADRTIVLTDDLTEEVALPYSIPAYDVDYVVEVENVGIKEKIMSGATRAVTNPKELLIAKQTAQVIEELDIVKNNFSFQTGSGGSSLAVTKYLRDSMIKKNVVADFALGGITGHIVKLHEEGLVKKLMDVQSFDLSAVSSLKDNKNHFEIDASYYADYSNTGN